MSDYHQPDFYRFNQDSLLLTKFIFSQLKSAEHILDLGAGSGVIGLELSQRLNPKSVTFLELQNEYKSFLERNIKEFLLDDIQSEILITSFGKFRRERKWDLIVCNPPYYFPDSGRPSPDSRRNTARSFLVDDWGILLNLISSHLSEKGKAFLVIKNEKMIWERVLDRMPEGLSWKKVDKEDLIFLTLSCLHKN